MNKITGFIVAGVIAAIVIGVVVKTVLFPAPDAPTRATAGAKFMEVSELTFSISEILGSEPSGAGNAGEDYAKAAQLINANEETVKDATPSLMKGEGQAYKAAIKILEEMRAHLGAGAQKASMQYLLVCGPKKLAVSTRQDAVTDMGQAIDVIDTLAEYYLANKRYKDAEALYKDMLVAGWHMMKSRSHIHMVTYGRDIMSDAMDGLSNSIDPATDKDEQHAKRLKLSKYFKSLPGFNIPYKAKAKILGKVLMDPGDIWKIANNDKDRMWRVQSILAMGLLKFSHKSKGNIKYNNEMIEKFLQSSDPLEKAAAEAAKAYTQLEYKHAGTTW
ncbi:MAG: hypothetical protein HN350_11820 [Phycisphaerales bacterium]|jgi:hypothetical protein|nr:hypothetical protein [Phycisphaerales bacterium]